MRRRQAWFGWGLTVASAFVLTGCPQPATPVATPQAQSAPATPHPALLDPSQAKETAPARFKVKCATTRGDFVIEIVRDWAPLGADRFYNLVRSGFFTDLAFFRNVPGFVVQFGIHGDPKVAQAWDGAKIPDDPVKESNRAGYVTFATSGPNTRTTQLFISHRDNANLDAMGFSPFGKVVEGMKTVGSLYFGYGENGPDQGRLTAEGNAYARKDFALLDYLKSATILP